MPERASGRKSTATLESTLSELAARVSDKAPRTEGSVLLRCTDTDEQFTVAGMGARGRVTKGESSTPPIVTVSGPSNTMHAILTGEMEAARAFASGGIRVRGDLTYLEAILKDLGLIDC